MDWYDRLDGWLSDTAERVAGLVLAAAVLVPLAVLIYKGVVYVDSSFPGLWADIGLGLLIGAGIMWVCFLSRHALDR